MRLGSQAKVKTDLNVIAADEGEICLLICFQKGLFGWADSKCDYRMKERGPVKMRN